MTNAAYNDIPVSYDISFLSSHTGISISGVTTGLTDATLKRITYEDTANGANFNTMSAALASYPTDYLSAAIPLRVEEVRNMRNKSVEAFTFNGISIPLDEATKGNITGAVSGLTRNTAVTGIDWSVGGGVFVTLSRDNIFALADAAFLHVQGCFTHAKDLIDQLKAAKDINALAAIDITAGWPA